ncbi:MAG TPA: ABC transporter substrate-binding protein [Steroidobacteraceae bacterium]|nr:ABC transporter substrate-binding protein [Steroidobacteraceae bacterium]
MKATPSRAAWLAGISALGAASAAGSASSRAEAQGLISVSAAAGLIEAQAEGYYAVDQGIFRKHGLDVKIQTLRNGAAIAAAVAGGSVEFGVSNTLQLAQSHAHNIPFKIVALGDMHDERYPLSGLIVSTSSGITSGKDLNGKTVGVATLRGLDQLGATAMIDKQGGDPSTVQFVEIGTTASLDALFQGRIAAITLEPPQLEAALATNRVRNLGDIENAIAPNWVATDWFSTSGYLRQNPDAGRRFAAAIYEAGQWSMANRAAAAAVLAKVLRSTEPETHARFATKSDPALLQSVLDVAVRYGYVAPTKATELLWSSG